MGVFSRSQQLLFATIVIFIIVGHTFFTISPSPPHFPAADPAGPHGQWIVEVIGSVPRPGIYLFNRAPSVNEAIKKAGGAENHLGVIQGSATRRLRSGTTVQVTSLQSQYEIVTCSLKNIHKSFVAGLPMDVNTASASELSLVPGISKRLARRIVTFRETRGGFRTWKDLHRVKGIGSVTVARLRDHLQILIPPVASHK
jgi:competence protein ComEA